MPAGLYDPFVLQTRLDPYPVYRELRERAPVHLSPLGFWVISRYADVAAAQRDRRLGLSGPIPPENVARLGQSRSAAREIVATYLMLTEPSLHQRYRAVVSRLFTARGLGSLQPLIQRHAVKLAGELRRRPEADLIRDFASPLTMHVLCDWLGVPPDDWPQCMIWSSRLNQILQPGLDLGSYPAVFLAFRACFDYFHRAAELRVGMPPDDLLSVLVNTSTNNGQVAVQESAAIACTLLAAAYETTTNLIGNGAAALLDHPEQMHRLRSAPELADQAVSEVLRYQSPVQMHARTALCDLRLGSRDIPAGAKILLLIGSAHRDETVYRHADQLLIGQPGPPTVSFGGGPHHCLGEALARMEAATALTVLLDGLDIAPADGEILRWRTDQVAIRGLVSLPARIRARR